MIKEPSVGELALFSKAELHSSYIPWLKYVDSDRFEN